MDIEQVFGTIVKTLQEMDAESTYGLRGYQDYLKEVGHSRFTGAGVQDEVPITNMLALKLQAKSLPASAEDPYSFGGNCDLVCSPEGNRLWLEAKVVYTVYFNGTRQRRAINIGRKFDDVVHDWNNKLCRLTSADATCIAALLLGFQTRDDPLDEDLVRTRIEAHLAKPWQRKDWIWDTRQSNRPHVPFQNRLWLWYRQLAQ